MNNDKLGYYLVGWKKFYNKTLALIESKKSGYEPLWIFNENVYDKINWTIPIETPLIELYKNRARQLRENYEHLVLYYSGGADSTNILHAFLDNNIFIDEIIMQLPEPVSSKINNKDYSNKNYYSEVEFAAVAHLKKVQNIIHKDTKITYQDFSKRGIEILKESYWIEQNHLCQNITISGVLRQLCLEYDQYNINLIEKNKKCCLILGIDKPLVYFNGKEYYSFFVDSGAYHYMTPTDFNLSLDSNQITTEFFYWTPDMPEIVIKQAQEIKKNCETNRFAKFMASEILTKHISQYRDILHPVIYPSYVIEEFQTEKPETSIYRPMDEWFWATVDQTVKTSYLEGIKYLKEQIDEKRAINANIENGFQSFSSKFYKL